MRVKNLVRDFFRLTPEIGKLLKKIALFSFVFELVKLVPPLIFAYLIDALVSFESQQVSLELLAAMVGGYFAGLFTLTILDIVTRNAWNKQIVNVEIDLTLKAVKKLLYLDINYHENNDTGANISKVVRGAYKIFELIFRTGEQLIPSTFQSIFTVCFLFYISPIIGLSYLLVVPFFTYLLLHNAKKTDIYRKKYHAYYDRFAAVVAQSMSNIRTVQDFYNQEKELKKSHALLKKYDDNWQLRTKFGLRGLFLEDLTINLARFLTLALSVWLMVESHISAGELVLIMTLTERAYLNLARLGRVYYQMQDATPTIARFNAIQDRKIKVQDKPSTSQVTKGSIAFNNVSFSYAKGEPALKNISFTLEPKSVTAFVGRSGSGKSTAIKLLLRHFDVTKGNITIDSIPLQDYSLKNLRQSIGVVSQDVELFNETIMNNIAYGRGNATLKEVKKASKMAHAHEFIMQFPQGYKTLIGERGVKLSGGQKQRLAIARALLRNPKILIFDEATSSLDSESEKFIHESIFNLIGQVTLIIIAHRFSTIEHADQIILLEQGKVKEIGTHKQLMQKKGIFAKLRKLQQLGEVS